MQYLTIPSKIQSNMRVTQTKTMIDKYRLIPFYNKQLRTFYRLGIGKKTVNGVIVTDTLISVTRRRLKQLQHMRNLK